MEQGTPVQVGPTRRGRSGKCNTVARGMPPQGVGDSEGLKGLLFVADFWRRRRGSPWRWWRRGCDRGQVMEQGTIVELTEIHLKKEVVRQCGSFSDGELAEFTLKKGQTTTCS